MTVEAVTYIDDLDPTLPSADGLGDPVSEGDDHIVNIKKALKNTLPNLSGPMTLTHSEINNLPSTITAGDAAVASAAALSLAATIASLTAQINELKLPVGSVYLSVVSTNPATLLGYGTWAQIAQGRALLGVGDGTDANSDTLSVTAEGTGGAYKHQLTVAEMPAHSHDLKVFVRDIDGASPDGDRSVKSDQAGVSGFVSSTGGDGKHNNIQPWFGVFVWKRTA